MKGKIQKNVVFHGGPLDSAGSPLSFFHNVPDGYGPQSGGSLLKLPSALASASPICFRLFWHCMRLAASRTFWTAGNSKPMSNEMMAMTTKSSIKVKPSHRFTIRKTATGDPPKNKENKERET